MFHIIVVRWDATSFECLRSSNAAAWAEVAAARADDYTAAIWVYSPDGRLIWEYNVVLEDEG